MVSTMCKNIKKLLNQSAKRDYQFFSEFDSMKLQKAVKEDKKYTNDTRIY